MSIPIGHGIAGYVARTGTPLIVPDVTKDPRFMEGNPALEGDVAVLCAPLAAAGEVLGVISVSGKQSGAEFTANDLRLLSDLAETAAIAYRNALHHSETEESGVFIANVMESLNLGLLVVDPERRVRMTNSEFLRLFGVTREEVMGNFCCSTVGRALGEPMNRLLDQAWEEGEDQHLEIIWETKRGDSIPLQMGVTLFRNRQMDIIGTLILFRDLSESHEFEQIRNLEKIKSNFVSTVSHELRTPLASMIGSISLLRTGMAGEVTVKQKKLLDILHRNSCRLKELIEDILDLSRLESAEATLDYEDANLLDIVKDAAGSLLEAAEKKKVKVSIGEGLDLRVRADAGKIRRVLLNLIGNALKFTPEGGRVTVGAEVEGAMVRVSVEDTGIGIPEEEQTKVFDKFYQVEDALVRTAQGSGLGLSICKSIIEMHGGEIGVRSTPEEGSSFKFSIPIRGHEPVEAAPDNRDRLPSRKTSS